MAKMHGRISKAVTVLTLTALILTGCTSEASSISSAKGKTEGAVDTGFTLSTVGSYDSADTAVVLATDETNNAVTLINMDTGKQYTLYYDGTTYVKDKYDGPMTISQIQAGDVVDVTFLKGKKRLASIKRSPEAWVYDDVYNYDLAGVNGTASIGSQSYSLPKSVVVLSEGQRVDKAEVVSQDVVSISGIDHKIYSVNVDKGHGYLSLKNEQPLLGGWIEVGNSVIRQITEDMLLVVPEGTYQVTLSNNGIGCVKNVTIERDKEVVLDVDDIEIPEDKTGKIIFDVTPDTTKVSVDGKAVDISKAVELPYGIHRVEASASGYDTLKKYIQVGSEYATISFTLEETRKESSDRESVSGNSATSEPKVWEDTYEPRDTSSVSDNTLSSVARPSQNGKIDVVVKDIDTDVELEGVKVTLEIRNSDKKVLSTRSKTSPCEFTKDKDGHTYQFVLSRDGYETKTFEPDLEEYTKDETLYFWLQKTKSGTNNNTNGSSNTRFSADVISAVATAGSNCDLLNGSQESKADAYIPSASVSLGNLWDSGKTKIISAVTEAVKGVVGTESIDSYYFKVADTLKDVTALASGDFEGTATVTISRNGYREENIPIRVIVKNETGTADDNLCKHHKEHTKDCGFVSASENETGSPCTYKCQICPIEELVDALPAEVTEDNAGEVRGQLNEILDLYQKLTEKEQGEIDPSRWEKLLKLQGELDITNKPGLPTPDDPANGVEPGEIEPETPSTLAIEGEESTENVGNTKVDGEEAENEKSNPSGTEEIVPSETDDTGDADEKADEAEDVDETDSVDGEATLTSETFEVQKNAHPIRNFFSSLFK